MNRDTLEQFQMAPKPPQLIAGQVKEGDLGLDVVLCRTYALYNTQLPLPKFNILDKPELYDAAKNYNFYFVGTGPVANEPERCERHPYTSLNLYWREAGRCPWFPK